MVFQERLARILAKPQEAYELFGEDVIGADVEPRAGTHFVDVIARLRQATKVTFGDQAQFVIVIEDDTAVA